MSAVVSSYPRLLTAEEFLRLPGNGRSRELVRGKVVQRNIPFPRHGHDCSAPSFRLAKFVKEQNLGWVMINNPGVVTERDPDTVRFPDVVYDSDQRLPKGELPDGCIVHAPEPDIEIRSSDVRRKDWRKKAGEYLEAGVVSACIVNPDGKTVHVLSADQPVRVLTDDGTLPETLPGFSIPLAQLFTV